MTRLSVVVPCFNESKNMSALLDAFSKCIGTRDMEVIFVNNGSTDESDATLRALIPRYAFAKSVNVAVNRGYGYGILVGLEEAEGAYMGWTHGDLQTDPQDIIRIYDLLDALDWPDNIFYKGLRRERVFSDQIFSVGMGLFCSLLFIRWLVDINAQPNVFPRRFYVSWKSPPHDYSIDLYVQVMGLKKELEFRRIPVRFSARRRGKSSWNTGIAAKWRFIWRMVLGSARLRLSLR